MALFDIIHTQGATVLRLLEALEGGADKLFASSATLAAVESHLFDVANTLAHLPPVVVLRLPQAEPRRDIVWYGASALLPATMVLLDTLRAQELEWFEIPC